MKKEFSVLFLTFVTVLANCQSADELTKQAKSLWHNGDRAKAVPLYLKAANRGNTEAQYMTGICYKEGIVYKKNDSIAGSWFLKSAEGGNTDAMEWMSMIAASNKDNYKKSFSWDLRCAEKMEPRCMGIVARAYESGDMGAEKNIDSMLIWLKKLALIDDRGVIETKGSAIVDARFKLGEMYRDGKYVPKDLEKSYMWFLIYNENKRQIWLDKQEENIKVIREVEKKLYAAERESAVSTAEELLKRPLRELSHLYSSGF
jgi:uncharacterized protein